MRHTSPKVGRVLVVLKGSKPYDRKVLLTLAKGRVREEGAGSGEGEGGVEPFSVATG